VEQLSQLTKRKREMEAAKTSEEPVTQPEVSSVVQEPEKAEEDSFEAEVKQMAEEDLDLKSEFSDLLEEEFTENENSNDIILHMYRSGSSVLDIARELGLGVGEVKLVIDLYQGE
jgi:hypothetical protein